MQPQPTMRAVFRTALVAGRRQGPCSCSAPLRLLQSPTRAKTPTPTPTATAHFFSTASPRLSASSTQSSSSSSSPASSPSSPEQAPPVLSSSVLAQLLFSASPSSTPSATPSAALASSGATGASNNNPSVYATVYIHGRPYLVTPGDSLRLPFHMAGVQPGDELRLDRVGVVGSRNVTAVSSPEPGAVPTFGGSVPGASVRAVVLGVETEPMRTMVKTKRRSRRKRTVKSKHHFTVLRIQEVVLEEQ